MTTERDRGLDETHADRADAGQLLAEPDIEVRVTLDSHAGHYAIDVLDSGSAVPAAVAECLFERTVPSRNGLGIGLYQAARQADSQGYRLALAENRSGRVVFTLSPQP